MARTAPHTDYTEELTTIFLKMPDSFGGSFSDIAYNLETCKVCICCPEISGERKDKERRMEKRGERRERSGRKENEDVGRRGR